MTTSDRAYLLRDLTRDLLHAGRLWRKLGRESAARHGVSEAATAPLLWLERLGDSVRQTTLAEAIGIEGASLVRLINELESAGLVTRQPDPTDRRANSVSLTATGRELVGRVNDDLQALRLKVFADLPIADLEAAARVFDALKQAAAADSAS